MNNQSQQYRTIKAKNNYNIILNKNIWVLKPDFKNGIKQ